MQLTNKKPPIYIFLLVFVLSITSLATINYHMRNPSTHFRIRSDYIVVLIGITLVLGMGLMLLERLITNKPIPTRFILLIILIILFLVLYGVLVLKEPITPLTS